MGKYKIHIIVGAIILLIIIALIIWNNSRNRKLALQAELDRQNQLLYPTTGGSSSAGGGGNFATNINSLSGLIGSIGGLFGKDKTTSDQAALVQQYANQCEQIYNTQTQVDACVAAKLANG